MSRRRGIQTPSSMELLLDAMCNVFGAVLFAAILLGGASAAKKLQDGAGGVPESQYQQTLRQLKLQSDQLQAVNMEYDLLTALHGNAPVEKSADNMQTVQAYQQQVKRANSLAEELEKLQTRVNKLRRQLELLNQYKHDPQALKKLTAAQEKLQQDLKNHRTEKVKLPELHNVSDQEPWWLLVTADEIFVIGSNQHVRKLQSAVPGARISMLEHAGEMVYHIVKTPGQGIKLSEFDFSMIALPESGSKTFVPGLLCEADATAHCALLIRELRRSNVNYLWQIVPDSGAVLRSSERSGYEVAR